MTGLDEIGPVETSNASAVNGKRRARMRQPVSDYRKHGHETADEQNTEDKDEIFQQPHVQRILPFGDLRC